MPASSPAERWRLRARTLGAMVLLCGAELLLRCFPLAWWRHTLGRMQAPTPAAADASSRAAALRARRRAAHVERGAARLPFAPRCLAQAMALVWMLRWAGIGYRCKIAARPAGQRDAGGGGEALHAWVEAGDAIVLGALAGPWIVVLTTYG